MSEESNPKPDSKSKIVQVHDRKLSLLQSAFDQVAAEKKEQQTKTRATRGIGGEAKGTEEARPNPAQPIIGDITDYVVEVHEDPSKKMTLKKAERRERGIVDTAKYCGKLAAGMAESMWDAVVHNDPAAFNSYKAQLTQKFGDCDPTYAEALKKYADFILHDGTIPYIPARGGEDQFGVVEGKLPADAMIGIVGDWGTGEKEALDVLKQIKKKNPQVVIHLGDIYYAGTQFEVDNYFYNPWHEILELDHSGITAFTLPGNHDYYSGGDPYYDMIKKLDQPASFFCLRNKDWQLIGMDTALHDKLGGPPTVLEESEAAWVIDKIKNADGRRTVLLSHHQLISANDQFEKKYYNEPLYNQLKDVLPQVDMWIWGHEHDLVIFGEDEKLGLKRGRLVGGSAFPVGKDEMPSTPKNPDVIFDKNVALGKGAAFYQHCYAMMKLDGKKATVEYYQDNDENKPLFTEQI
ncbi:MAG: metallophosphoesterase [Pyrinomonadaceae bacterium]